MKRLFYALLAALAAMSAPAHALDRAPASMQASQDVYVPFDPPIGEPLRYRWEKTRIRDGQTRMEWSLASHVFETHGDGFKLTVTPISSGSNETDPKRLELERKYSELTDFPFVLTLSADGSITGLEKSEVYWSAIDSAVRDYASTATPQVAAGITAVAKLMAEMPEEARLGLLTESVQPLMELGDTDWRTGEPVTAELEAPSLWGGTYKSRVVITPGKVVGDVASFSITTTVPRGELDAMVAAFGKKMPVLPPDKQQELQTAIAGLKDFRHETRSSYAVSIADGMLHRYESTETVEATEADKINKSLTTRSLVLVD